MDTFQPDEKAIQELAIQFTRAIPEYEFSMASLQGFLLLYKTRPLEAAQNVAKWVNDAREIQAARENMTTSSNTKPTPPLTPASLSVHLADDSDAMGAS
jgi:chaperone BCS1